MLEKMLNVVYLCQPGAFAGGRRRLSVWSAPPLAANDVTRHKAAVLCMQFISSLHMWESFDFNSFIFRFSFFPQKTQSVFDFVGYDYYYYYYQM